MQEIPGKNLLDLVNKTNGTKSQFNWHIYLLAGLALTSILIGMWLLRLVDSPGTLFLVGTLVTMCLLLIRYVNQLIEFNRKSAASIDAIAEIYWEWDLLTGVFSYNNRLSKLLGHADTNTPFSKELIHPVDRPQQKYQLLRHLGDESIPYYCEYRICDHNGDYHWFAGRGKVVLRDDHHNPQVMVGSLEYIQHRKDLEQRLVQAQKMEALGRLTGGIAHDFNNILASMMGYTELALESPTHPKIAHYLEQVHQGGTRAKSVVRQLLDFSRVSKAEKEIVKLQDQIVAAVKMLRSTFPTTVEIVEEYPSKICYTQVDPNQLQRVLLNLCINARDAMRDKGHLTLTLQSREVQDQVCSSCQTVFDGPYHLLTIADDGDGIDTDIQNKMFEPFFTTKKFGEGTGMGLSVVHGIVHDYDGHISIQSQPSAGTSVCLYFPAHHNQENEETPSPAAHEFEAVQLNQRILVVEDDNSVASFLLELLNSCGCKVDVANSSTDAIISIRGGSTYDIVISDQTMPCMTGTEFAQKLYLLKPDLPVILYSGSGLKAAECTANVRHVLHKPIDNRRLIHTIAGLSISK